MRSLLTRRVLKCISITLAVTIFTLSLSVNTARSDVAAELGSMFDALGFNAAVSEPGAYQSQSRNYMMGGNIRARSSTKYIQPVNIQVPSFKAGCGGIDMNFGGFSFISAEEFKTFLQQAGTQALGYAFSLALEAVCPTCRSILDTLRKMADTINKFGLDSCTAAKAAVNTAFTAVGGRFEDGIPKWGETSSPEVGEDQGLWSPFKSKMEAFSKGLDDLHRGIYDAARTNKNPSLKVGVSTAENLSSALTEEQMELAISLLGTMAPAWGSATSGESMPIATCEDMAPSLTVEDLMKGARDPSHPPQIIKCTVGSFQDHSCEQVGYAPMNSSFKGYEEFARLQLEGILANMQANQPLTASHKDFISSVNIPILSAIRTSLSATPEVAYAMIGEITELAALAYALHIYKNYILTYKLNARKHICADIPAERYRKANEDFHRQAEIYSKNIFMLDAVVKMLKTIERTANEAATKRLNAAILPVNW